MNSARSVGDPIALPQPGDVVAGKYRVDSVVGTGGMGVVLGAQDVTLGRSVAIKFLAPHKARRDGAVARFLREARSAAAIQSEHVVRVYEVGELPGGSPYIVMEHLRGSDLSQVVASRGGLPIDEAVDYVLQACEALAEAHGRGIVHRDLKPQNLFVAQRPDGSAALKVLDFGISKAVDEESLNLTSTDQVMGTPLYMSPEQVRSLKNVDHRSDIWALGSILFELLTASPIFEAPSATALCAMIAMDPPTPLRARRPSAPAELEAIILRCLHKDPAGRFQDVGALAQALAGFASERGRASVLRTSHVVRSTGGGAAGRTPAPSPSGAAFALTTADASGGFRSSYVPHLSAPPVAGVSNRPPGGALVLSPQTTQDTWQHTGATEPPRRRGTSSVVVAFVGVLTGMLVLGLISLGAYVAYAHRVGGEVSAPSRPAGEETTEGKPAQGAKPSPPEPSAALANGPATLPRPISPDPDVADPEPSASSTKAPSTKPAKPAKPGGGAAPASSASKEDEERARLKQIADGQCRHYNMLLSMNQPGVNAQAKQVKDFTCLPSFGPNAVACQRATCRSACSMLQDQSCLRQLDVAERNYPPRF